MRSLATCVGTLTLRIPKLCTGSFFPDDAIERYQRVDRALVTAVAEMYATGTSTRKVQRVAEKMGVSRPSKDQVSAIASSLDADIDELCSRPLDGGPVPYVWLDATYVECCRGAAWPPRPSSRPSAATRAAGGARWASAWWTPSRMTRGWPSSAAYSTGTLRRMSLMKEIQTGSGFRQCSRTVPVGEVNLLPQQRQRHLETPAAVDPFLQTPPAPHSGPPGPAGRPRRPRRACPRRPPRGCASRLRLP